MNTPLRVTIWNEFLHERTSDVVKRIYPAGMHAVWAEALRRQLGDQIAVRMALLDEPEHGLTEEVLEQTDVLTWWGHMAHGDVSDAIVAKVRTRVLEGMGLIVLHSGHYSKIFKSLMGDTCSLTWREATDKERLWVVNPSHPIAQGLGAYFEIPA